MRWRYCRNPFEPNEGYWFKTYPAEWCNDVMVRMLHVRDGKVKLGHNFWIGSHQLAKARQL